MTAISSSSARKTYLRGGFDWQNSDPFAHDRLLRSLEAIRCYSVPCRHAATPRLPADVYQAVADRLRELHPSVRRDLLRVSRYAPWLREYGHELVVLATILAPLQKSLERKKRQQIEAVLSASRKGSGQ